MSCCAHCRDARDFFGERAARRELKRYRRKGPVKTTAMLLRELRRGDVEGRTLLDVGGGVGALQHELLDDGVARVLNVDASTAYQEAVRREAGRRGTLDRIDFWNGDFTGIAPGLPEADLVTLDRVVCCYPDMPALVGEAAGRAREVVGLVLPRENWWVRAGVSALNLFQRLRRKAFRVYVHPTLAVQAEVERAGFVRDSLQKTFLWQVMTFRRAS